MPMCCEGGSLQLPLHRLYLYYLCMILLITVYATITVKIWTDTPSCQFGCVYVQGSDTCVVCMCTMQTTLYTAYSTRMSPEIIYKLMGLYK